MVVLVTGGSGFVGDNLTKKLVKRGEKVVNIDVLEPTERIKGVTFHSCDVTDYGQVERLIGEIRPSTVYHTAAKIPISKAGRGFMDVNVGGTENVMLACMEHGVKRVVHTSSSSVYDIDHAELPMSENALIKPFEPYGRAKWAAELVCQKYAKKGLNVSIIRPRTIMGEERAGIFQIMFKWISEDTNVPVMGDGSNLFQFVSVDDVSRAMMLAAEKKGISGEAFNLGADKFGTLREDIEALIDHAGSKSRVVPFNASLARIGLKTLDLMGLSPMAKWHYMSMDKPFYFDTRKAKKVLGWKPKDNNLDVYFRSYDWYVRNKRTVDARKGTIHRSSPRQRLFGWIVRNFI